MNKQNIGLKILVCALVLLDIGVHCVRAQTDAAKLLKTQDLQIVDSSGQSMIELNVTKEGDPLFTLIDPQGNVRLGLIVDPDGGHLQMINTAGKTTLAVSGNDTPGVRLFKDNEMKGQLGLNVAGWPILTLGESEDNDRVSLGYDPKGDRSIFQLSDKDGKQTAEMALIPSDSIIDVTDKASIRRAVLKCTADNSPSIYLADTNGDPIWTQDSSNSP